MKQKLSQNSRNASKQERQVMSDKENKTEGQISFLAVFQESI